MLHVATGIFWPKGRINVKLLIAISATSLVQTVAVICGSLLDHTWHMGGDGKGLSQHYAAWCVLATDPLLLVLTGYTYYRFRLTMAELPGREGRHSELRKLTTPYLKYLSARRNSKYAYLLCIIVGVLAWANNIHQTINPEPYYHHAVFDSLSHPFGFAAYKFCLLLSWVFVYPTIGFLLVTMSVSTFRILRMARTKQLFSLRVTHPDNCYGLRNFGTLNVSLLAPYLLVYVLMLSIMLTLGLYPSIEIPLILVTLLFLIMSYVVIIPAYGLLKEARSTTFSELAAQSRTGASSADRKTLEFAVERLCFATATSSPYTQNAKILLNVLRVIPFAATTLKLLELFHVLA
jgi:hypothetical protein